MKRLLREPLLHFAVLGAALFVLNAWIGGTRIETTDDAIVVTQGDIESMTARFVKTRQRPPSPQELRGLVDDHVLEQALYREAMTLGLDLDDTIVRRRLRQKMEFVVKDVVEPPLATDAQLEAWLADHSRDYALPTSCSFRQIQLKPDKRGESILDDVRQLLKRLRGGIDAKTASGLGDATLLEHAHAAVAPQVISGQFGPGFTKSLLALPTNIWSGPIESPFGLHLVIIDERQNGRLSSLSEVRSEVQRDWSHAQRQAAMQLYYRELVDRYQVRIDWPKD